MLHQDQGNEPAVRMLVGYGLSKDALEYLWRSFCNQPVVANIVQTPDGRYPKPTFLVFFRSTLQNPRICPDCVLASLIWLLVSSFSLWWFWLWREREPQEREILPKMRSEDAPLTF